MPSTFKRNLVSKEMSGWARIFTPPLATLTAPEYPATPHPAHSHPHKATATPPQTRCSRTAPVQNKSIERERSLNDRIPRERLPVVHHFLRAGERHPFPLRIPDRAALVVQFHLAGESVLGEPRLRPLQNLARPRSRLGVCEKAGRHLRGCVNALAGIDRKSTRLKSRHLGI